ncbi:MAG: hypothetical protein O2923_01360 [Verrucomicrobia bacterium]|nr:hypothetical protein [Verrucomicrobiota bacterium]MDA1085441.1 hypothetical protein [Verrucomicrobiota bacterium]
MSASITGTARDVFRDALRRKENAIIIAVAAAMIVAIMSLDFFGLDGVTRIYREGVLRIISLATALCVIVLAARQLRCGAPSGACGRVLAGKALGVLCYAAGILLVLTLVFAAAGTSRPGVVPWPMYLEFIYLQLLMMLALAAVCFVLSAAMNLDAAICAGILFYLIGISASGVVLVMYPYSTSLVRALFAAANYGFPQLLVFDLRSRTVHAEAWPLLSVLPLLLITAYGIVYSAAYGWLASWIVSRKQRRARA